MVDFPSTHTFARRALEAGGGTREQTARSYVLLAISAAALGDTEEATLDFERALAIDPSFKLSAGVSPKIREPYLEAKGHRSASAEQLTLRVKPTDDGEHLVIQLLDPTSLVAGLELRMAVRGSEQHRTVALASKKTTRFAVPNDLRDRDYELTLRALDRYGNVIAEQGTDAEPVQVRKSAAARTNTAAFPSSARDRSYLLPVLLGVSGLGAVAAGVVFHVEREQEAHDWNGPGCENAGQTRRQQCQGIDSRRRNDERWAAGFYAAGGALLTGSLILLVTGQEASAENAKVAGCGWAGTGVVCNGRF
jgi:hypothetical protein